MSDGNCIELNILSNQKYVGKQENYHQSQQQQSILSLELPLVKNEYSTKMLKNHIYNHSTQHQNSQELFQSPKDYFSIIRLVLFYIIMFFGILIGSFIIYKMVIVLFSFISSVLFEKDS
ncbi:transmembrane protein, putative (macronuclear) [Tetrahymena thermophila SB210]|uniref:Transmembrane protein, putative n=1 Tax=Tetrahymena thermophila (strain SB210) TaxID=312017 RepID=Q22SA2_TETTS|nr:transmembrane protein, putative [Tetrahymena thermophila SB210]EAR87870.1 transmembrane protein, putative [Tetrahymena thermophila SB210]|eukprot:XP_001008115.1 transmembrane protein, putative [Tetrahymena thermophila SB210]